MCWHPWYQVRNLPRSLWVVCGFFAWHPWWQVGNFFRSLSMGGPALHTRLFWSRIQTSWVCLLARCVCSDLGSFLLEPKFHGWQSAILVEVSNSTFFYILYAILTEPLPFYWPCSPQVLVSSLVASLIIIASCWFFYEPEPVLIFVHIVSHSNLQKKKVWGDMINLNTWENWA